MAWVGLALSLGGCAATGEHGEVGPVYEAYRAGDFEKAYALARDVAAEEEHPALLDAAYMAGMSAYQLGKLGQAEYYLRYAAASSDGALAADARAGLGLAYLHMGRYAGAEAALLDAARGLNGQDRANAFFYAAVAQQRQGYWSQARASLIQARAASTDGAFAERCNQQLAATGYTLQMGAFRKQENAVQCVRQWEGRAQRAKLAPPRLYAVRGASGQKLYVVYLGQFSTHGSALAAKGSMGAAEAAVVGMPAN